MSDDDGLKKKLGFDPDRCTALYEDLLTVFQNHKPTVGELIIALGNLEYAIGASIGGYKDKGPPFEELQKLYYSATQNGGPPPIDIAIMLSGMQMTLWFDQYEEEFLKYQEKIE